MRTAGLSMGYIGVVDSGVKIETIIELSKSPTTIIHKYVKNPVPLLGDNTF